MTLNLSQFDNGTLAAEWFRRERLQRWRHDPLAFGRELFPHHFYRPAAPMHQAMIGRLCPPAQTTTPGHGAQFVILISNTYEQAVKFLQPIKHELETNDLLRRNFPTLKPNPDKWREDEIEVAYDGRRIKLMVLGSEAQLRGMKFLQHRPDLVIIDDGENDEMVRSEQRRQHFQWWLDHVVLQANVWQRKVAIAAPRQFAKSTVGAFLVPLWSVLLGDGVPTLLFQGTVLHEASLLNRLITSTEPKDRERYSDWSTDRFQALDASEASTWPEFQTTEQLYQERSRDPYGFAQEKMNLPVPADFSPFTTELFGEERWYTQLPDALSISITVDLACTDKEYSDETAIVTAGWDAEGRLWVLNLLHGKYTNPSDIIDLLLDEYVRWKTNEATHPTQTVYCVGIEKNGFQRFLIHNFKQACQARHLHPFVKELPGDKDKTRRIWQLEPLFRENRIFLRPDMVSLESQLKMFPNGQHDDQADALAFQLALGQVRPQPVSERPTTEALTFKQYAELNESMAALRRRLPELDALTLGQLRTWN